VLPALDLAKPVENLLTDVPFFPRHLRCSINADCSARYSSSDRYSCTSRLNVLVSIKLCTALYTAMPYTVNSGRKFLSLSLCRHGLQLSIHADHQNTGSSFGSL
jgi:hypothetical protein